MPISDTHATERAGGEKRHDRHAGVGGPPGRAGHDPLLRCASMLLGPALRWLMSVVRITLRVYPICNIFVPLRFFFNEPMHKLVMYSKAAYDALLVAASVTCQKLRHLYCQGRC